MKRFNSRPLWIIIAVFAVVPTIYFIFRVSDPAFRDNAMGNWFATMIGALIGVLIAIEINRAQQAQQERRDQIENEKEENFHKTKILQLVKRELEYNRKSLTERQSNSNEANTQRKVFVNRLKDELWNAFSDGGELRWIKDLELLDFISTAYYHIRTIIFLEEKYLEALHFPGMRVQQTKYPQDYFLDYLSKTDPEVIRQIDKALDEIEKSLAQLKTV